MHFIIAMFLFVSVPSLPPPPDITPVRPKVCVQPLGKYRRPLLGKAVTGIKTLYNFRVTVLEIVKMPSEAWHAPRRRWRADRLLNFLEAEILPHKGCSFVVGFTSLDISTTKGQHKDWGIFGLGSSTLKSCVISTHRLGRRSTNKNQKKIRTIKVVNHEIGHVLGLGHCPTPHCLMNDARGSITTVDKESGLFCELCRRELQRRHKTILPQLQKVDWEKLVR